MVASNRSERSLVVDARISAKAAKHHALDRWRSTQSVKRGGDGDPCCAVLRKAVGAGRDRREGNRSEVMLKRKAQAVAIAESEQAMFASVAPAPNRPHRVDDVARGQSEARGDLRLSRLATA